jgi:hypothetical protein
VDRLGDKRFRARRTKLERAMRPPRVVVRGIQGKHPTEMPLSVDQHPVGELGPDGVGAENSVTSCDLQILVNEAAEPVTTQRPDGRCGGRVGFQNSAVAPSSHFKLRVRTR